MKAIQNLHSWNSAGGGPIDASIYSDIVGNLKKPYYPDAMSIPRAFTFFKPKETRVVILGQDPYYTEGKASGIAFGYKDGYEGPLNSSLKNIMAVSGTPDRSLESWAAQGVLLMNTIWTVEPGKPGSHAGIGWEEITKDVLAFLDFQYQNKVAYILLGSRAQKFKSVLVNTKPVLILETSHPCSKSAHRGFLESAVFDEANSALIKIAGRKPIKWSEP